MSTKKPRKPSSEWNRKPYRQFRVFDNKAPHGVNPKLVLRIYPNGVVEISEHKRRARYSTNVSSIYVSCIFAEVRQKQADKRAAKKARRLQKY